MSESEYRPEVAEAFPAVGVQEGQPIKATIAIPPGSVWSLIVMRYGIEHETVSDEEMLGLKRAQEEAVAGDPVAKMARELAISKNACLHEPEQARRAALERYGLRAPDRTPYKSIQALAADLRDVVDHADEDAHSFRTRDVTDALEAVEAWLEEINEQEETHG